MGKVVTREWRKAKSAKLEFAVVSTFRDIQVLDSISWVRCASGNVFISLQWFIVSQQVYIGSDAKLTLSDRKSYWRKSPI